MEPEETQSFTSADLDPSDIHSKGKRIRWNGLKGIQYTLDPDAVMIVLPWPDSIEKPFIVVRGNYRSVRTGVQPRITKCYNRSYKYSGQVHPVEAVTPDNIQAIIDFTVEMYSTENKPTSIPSIIGSEVPMCLSNYYPTCHHCINRHSDDEKQFSPNIPDVICWILGGENRRLIIRNAETKRNIKKGIVGKIVLSLHLSNCIYIMSGSKFQTNYTHEIPREYGALFKRMCENPKVPDDLESLLKADWLLVHSEVGSKYPGYDEWVKGRTSFTIRFFAS